jgi:hypothetical protein
VKGGFYQRLAVANSPFVFQLDEELAFRRWRQAPFRAAGVDPPALFPSYC